MDKNQTLKRVAMVIAIAVIILLIITAYNGKPQASPKLTLPDLIIEDLYKESSSCTGGSNSICTFTLSAIVKNMGSVDSEKNVLEVSINDGVYTDYGQIPALSVGQSAKVFTGFLNVPQGNYGADAKADYLDKVNEIKEGNNEKTLNFKLP